ncbi:MAG TPA: SGNH/GDSL hydrolase family protein [Cellvibrionaceae bacterium]
MSKIISRVLMAAVYFFSYTLSAAELQQLPAHVGGRVIAKRQANGDTAYSYAWLSIYFETAFRGDKLELKFADDKSKFRLLVDDQAPVIINRPGMLSYSVPGLTRGKHKVRLEKLSETQNQTAQFLGFYTPSTGKPISLQPREVQIEFIGDSYTVGYGNLSVRKECTDEQLFNNTDSQLAFGPLVAKHFNADYQVNAYSGQGVVRNYSGILPETNLILRYPYALHDMKTVYANNNWHPQVIVVGLGTNDFSTALQPNERWQSRAALQNDFVANYVEFIKQLHSKNRSANFVLMASDQMQGEVASQMQKVAAQLRAAGVTQLQAIEFKHLSYSGCHGHPSVKDGQLLAKLLIEHLNALKLR